MASGRRKRPIAINMETEVSHKEKSGWLTKKGKWALGESWKRRWFELKNQRLTYYVGEGEEPKGSILMKLVTGVSACVTSECKKENSFKIETPSRTYFCFADTRQEMIDWLTALEERVSYWGMKRELDETLFGVAFSAQNPEKVFEDNRKKGQIAAEKTYSEYLLRAENSDLSDIKHLQLVQMAGKDKKGRPVVVFPCSSLPAGLDLDRLLLYMIKFMDPVVKNEFSLVYVHSNLSENRPKFSWIRKVLAIFNRRYKKNLKTLWLVHPTLWVKAVFKFIKPFISEKFFKKLIYIEAIPELYDYMDRKNLKMLTSGVINWEAHLEEAGGGPIFGAHLDELLNRPDQTSDVPAVVNDCIAYLSKEGNLEEGVFRLSGSKLKVAQYQAAYDSGSKPDLFEEMDPNVIASLMKLYFRELPEPLLTFDLYDNFVDAMNNENKDAKVKALKSLVYTLPPSNFKVLEVLVRFLKFVSTKSSVTKMDTKNIALVFAPNILRPDSSSPMANLVDAGSVNACCLMLIEHTDTIFAPVQHTLATADTKDEKAFDQAFTKLEKRASGRASKRSIGKEAAGKEAAGKETKETGAKKEKGSSRRKAPSKRNSSSSKGSKRGGSKTRKKKDEK